MPVSNPPVVSGGGGGGIVSIDADGYTVVTGGSFPFKDLEEDLGNGYTRLHHMIKHPVFGEVSIAFSDHLNP